jgi:hypothetical protein
MTESGVLALSGRAFTRAAKARKAASSCRPTPAGSLPVHFQLPGAKDWQNT